MVKRAVQTFGVLVFLLLVIEIGLHPLAAAFGIGVYPAPSGTPWTYQLESGFLPSLTVITLVSIFSGAWHHVNCHHPHCWRIGKHKINGTPWCNTHQDEARPDRTENEILVSIENSLGELVILLKERG
jgi:hypothetical protein